jgi:hypothetical protein
MAILREAEGQKPAKANFREAGLVCNIVVAMK